MSDLPNSVALTEIADSSDLVAAPVRNNFSAIQSAVNALRAALAGGAAGQVLTASDSDTVAWGARRVTGNVQSTGAIVAGSGYSVTRNSAGNYTITFTTAFSAAPVVVANSASDTSARIVQVSSIAAGSFVVLTFNSSGAATDLQFTFIACEVI